MRQLQLINYYSLRTLSGYNSEVSGRKVDGLSVKGFNEKTWYPLPTLLSNDFIPNSRGEVATPTIVKLHDHLKHLSHHYLNKKDVPVLMLLGVDAGEVMHTKCHGKHAPYAHESPLGWALVGSACINGGHCLNSVKTLKTAVICNEYSFSANPLFSHVKQIETNIFREFVGDEESDHSRDERKFLELMSCKVEVSKGHIVLPLPFQTPRPKMPVNRNAVFHRLSRDGGKLKQCLQSIHTNLQKGHIGKIPRDKITPRNKNCVWLSAYLRSNSPKEKEGTLGF